MASRHDVVLFDCESELYILCPHIYESEEYRKHDIIYIYINYNDDDDMTMTMQIVFANGLYWVMLKHKLL